MRRGALLNAATRPISVIVATVFFLVVGLALTALMAHVVRTMVASADLIDDRRATQAVASAIDATQSRMAATVRDNTVWDQAYEAIMGPDAERFAYDNWGETTEQYPLYDAAVVTDPSGRPVSSYLHGRVFDADAMFGAAFDALVDATSLPSHPPHVVFLKAGNAIFLVGSNAFQPFEPNPSLSSRLPVLTLMKEVTPALIAELARDHDVQGLRLTQAPVEGGLNMALRAADGGVIANLTWDRRHPGRTIYLAVRPFILIALVILMIFLGGVLVFGVVEMRRLRQLANASRHEATHDGLSGLLNRTGLLLQMAELQKAHGQPVSLHLVDLDGFKAVNDAWGHAMGDALIVHVATALASAHPEIEAAARLGGDEFALLQVGLPSDALLSAVLDVFKAPILIHEQAIEVGASIGSAGSAGAIAPLELLRRADMALYRAKADGRGRSVLYDPRLDEERLRLSEQEKELREAIALGTIWLEFQPLVDARDGTVVGVEALARWTGPKGPVTPDVFIPLAERAGLIDPLGRHILTLALRKAKRWPQLSLSVNVSPVQLCLPDFAARIAAILERESFDPHRLTLEVTEGVLITNPDQARHSIHALRGIGVRFALDDFGCGYASIGALRTFGFDRVKLDRSLIAAVDEEASGTEVLNATIRLANALQVLVTAEGIETPRQAEALRQAGCDQLQGYLLGRPMAAEKIDKLVPTTTAA